jgi:DMSO/TMAO reductase YedYZ molybdopterin-dependent catalytic subunit
MRKQILLLIFIFAMTLAGGCTQTGLAGKPQTGAEQKTAAADESDQPGKEIREYKGEKLGSLGDFHDNSIKGAQKVDVLKYQLKVDGLVGSPLKLTYDEAIRKYGGHKKVVTINCVEGWDVKILWEGLLVRDLLKDAKLKDAARIVIFHSADGYTTSLPIEYLTENNIMMAYRMNGLAMPPARGFPFELVAEGKWGYKWAKWIVRLEVSADENYKGYWERAGYNNNGDLSKPMFEQ